ncbi:asparaginase domain-containing protein [Paraflavitalea speifideaquila]|uniref:asparaginase domain-containing protein n=1 Tax=Paraflavitalea speifideaquila TaxID=3076558 RepID=UPI0028E98270|nr:asparaginase domain-containing protein [Paraflavitalea speifideiaquila]
MPIQPIRIFITGGTFDKEYNELNGQLFFKDTQMHDLLEMGRNKVPVVIRTLMMIDSLDMTKEDRDLIVHQCIQCEEDKIIITHGTDTMAITAKVLAESIKNKTIVLTGAMIPIKFGSSDGLFNLGSAMAFAQSLPPGVYVAMNGRFSTGTMCGRINKREFLKRWSNVWSRIFEIYGVGRMGGVIF